MPAIPKEFEQNPIPEEPKEIDESIQQNTQEDTSEERVSEKDLFRKDSSGKKAPGYFAEAFLRKAVLLLAGGIFAILAIYAQKYTEFFKDYSQEYLENYLDHTGKNMSWFMGIVLALIILGGLVLGRAGLKQQEKNRQRNARIMRFFLAAVSICYFVAALLWVRLTRSVPYGDQAFLSMSAENFLAGNYSSLNADGYLGMMPHQLGITFVLEVMYRIFGTGKYVVFQYFNAFCTPLLVISGYQVVQRLFKSAHAAFFYLLLMCSCLQLFLYVPYVYGEISSTTFMMLSAWLLLTYTEHHDFRYALGGAVAAAIAVILRENSVIFVIAAVLALTIQAISEKRKKSFLAVILVIALTILGTGMIQNYYARMAGHKLYAGIPATAYIAMGLQDEWPNPGWYNNYNKACIQQSGFNSEVANDMAKSYIHNRLLAMWQNKPAGMEFFKTKTWTQWNEPTMDSFWVNRSFAEQPSPESFVYKVFDGAHNGRIIMFMNYMQFIVYVLFTIAMLASLVRKQKMADLMPVIYVLGGFFFSILWEAKSRYIFPYYVFMLLYASYGVYVIAERMDYFLAKYFTERPKLQKRAGGQADENPCAAEPQEKTHRKKILPFPVKK